MKKAVQTIKKIIMLFFIMTVLVACSEDRVKIDQLINSSTIKKDIDNVYTDEFTVDIFKSAVQNAMKVDGIVDVSDPMYIFKLAGEKYFLWLFDDGGSLMKSNDTHTIYRLIEDDAKQLREILKY